MKRKYNAIESLSLHSIRHEDMRQFIHPLVEIMRKDIVNDVVEFNADTSAYNTVVKYINEQNLFTGQFQKSGLKTFVEIDIDQLLNLKKPFITYWVSKKELPLELIHHSSLKLKPSSKKSTMNKKTREHRTARRDHAIGANSFRPAAIKISDFEKQRLLDFEKLNVKKRKLLDLLLLAQIGVDNSLSFLNDEVFPKYLAECQNIEDHINTSQIPTDFYRFTLSDLGVIDESE